MLVELPIRIKTYDIDSAKHVNNIVYVRWLEDLRLHFLDTHLPLETLHEQGITPIIVETNIHYRQPVRLGEKMVTGQLWIERTERATVHLAAQFLVNDEVRCTARQRGAFIDLKKNRAVRVPEALCVESS
jgi:acyl-CoA thioester hydrolase